MATTIEIKTKDGKSAGKHSVSEKITEAQANPHVLHRALVAEEANKRQGTQSARTRSEVSGGGRKPYKQKKTGNARQGSTRAPHYAHGAMALAVKPRGYDKKVNRKERRAAILGALKNKIEGENLVVADTIVFAAPKTKDAAGLLKALDLAGAKRLLIILPKYDETTFKSFRNLPNVEVRTAPSNEDGAKTAVFSARDVLVAHKVLIAMEALQQIEEVWAK